MKKTLTAITLMLISTTTFAQQKPDAVVGTSEVSRKNKLVESFTLGKKKYNVYLVNKTPDEDLRQQKTDQLKVYKIVPDKAKYSDLEITKLATRKGKIIGEGKYKVVNNTLMVYNDSYDYSGAYRITETYVLKKYGLEKASDKMEPINTDNLPNTYLKPAEMKQPFPSKN